MLHLKAKLPCVLDLTNSAAKQSNVSMCVQLNWLFWAASWALRAPHTVGGGRKTQPESTQALQQNSVPLDSPHSSEFMHLQTAVRRDGDGGEEEQRTRLRDHKVRPKDRRQKEELSGNRSFTSHLCEHIITSSIQISSKTKTLHVS